MSTAKDEAIRLISDLPDDCTLEQIQYHLYVRQKIQLGLRAVENGELIDEQSAEQRLAPWLKSSGPSQP